MCLFGQWRGCAVADKAEEHRVPAAVFPYMQDGYFYMHMYEKLQAM